MSPNQVKNHLEQLDTSNDRRRAELMTQLAWRPAWAIRSRRGALREFVKLFNRKKSAQ